MMSLVSTQHVPDVSDVSLNSRSHFCSQLLACSCSLARNCLIACRDPPLSVKSVMSGPWANGPNADWKAEDIFKLNPVELDKLKLFVATKLECRYKSVDGGPFHWSYAEPVGGTTAFTEESAKEAITNCQKVLSEKPTKGSSESEESFKNKEDAWITKFARASSWSCVVNGCQLSWQSPNGPWNEGYIMSFLEKLQSGETQWDMTIDRKAGGVRVKETMDFTSINLIPMNASPIMALIASVVFHVVREGKCPPRLKEAFKSLKVTWLFTATIDEIINLSMKENMDQHLRKRHTEFDNLFQVKQWMDTMPRVAAAAGKLDPKKAIDVVKYALVMGDPLRPGEVPVWLKPLLKGGPPTIDVKIRAVCGTGVTKQWLTDNKVLIDHPEMKNYARVVARVRAVVGFTQWEELHKQVVQEMGRRGMGHKQCPLTSGLLLDPAILSAAAFSTKGEKENIPVWRSGENAAVIQSAMVEVARARLFDHGFHEERCKKALFANGLHWTAFARINGPPHYHLDMCLQKEFGPMASWQDSVQSLRKAVWNGEHDADLAKICSLLPSNIDAQPVQFHARLKELFAPIQQLVHVRATEAYRLHSTQQEREEAAKKEAEEEAKKQAATEKVDVDDVLGVREDGDVTDDLCPEADSAAKRKTCDQMNAMAKKKRDADLAQAVLLAAASILRSRVVVVDSMAAAKLYMESSTKEGYKVRICYTDFTQHPSLVSQGQYSKVLCVQPNAKFQQELAEKVLAMPMTPIIGSVLSRAGGVTLESFNEKLGSAYGRPRSMFVPVAMPPSFLKHIKSASRRALGPHIDVNERSGIEFSMRMVGARSTDMTSDGLQVDADDEVEEDMDEDDQNDGAGDADMVTPIEVMTKENMKKAFGRAALWMLGAMFQHTEKICEEGEFVDPRNLIQMTTDSGRKRTYRKSQVHPTTVLSALKSVLSTTSASLNPQDIFVQVCGGSPEGVVAAILLGFSKVLYVGNEKEQLWMKMPSDEDEKMYNIDYQDYPSPDMDFPDQGFLAAEAVKMLAPYIQNHVLDRPNSLKVAPPQDITVPPIKQYTFIAVTGRVILRTVMPASDADKKDTKTDSKSESKSQGKNVKQAASSSSSGNKDAKGPGKDGGPGSAAGKKPPVTPKAKGKKLTADEDVDEDFDEEDDAAILDDEDGIDNELAALDELESAAVPKKRGRPPKEGSASAKKKGKKAA